MSNFIDAAHRLESEATHFEAQKNYGIAIQLRIMAGKQWFKAAGEQPTGSDVYAEWIGNAERNYRALAANADRLADALSALRGRAG